MSSPLRYNHSWSPQDAVTFLKAARSYVQGLAGEQADDQQLIADTLEGIENVDKAMCALVDLFNDLRATAAAKGARAKDYADAAAHDLNRATMVKDLIRKSLETIGQRKWQGIAGTAYMHEGSWSTEIIDPAVIPFQYLIPMPNTARIKAALTEKLKELGPAATKVHLVDLPGACLTKGDDYLVVLKPKKAKEAT